MVTNIPQAVPLSATSALDDLNWMVEQILLEGELPIDRSGLRRALQEACDAHSGPPVENWWVWITEGAASLGLRCRCIEGTAADLLEFAECGAPFIFWSPRSAEFLGLSAAKGKRWNVMRGGSERATRWMRRAELKSLLTQETPEVLLRAVVFEGKSTATFQEIEHHHASPFQRVKGLLRPEWSDIWVILVYTVVNGVLALASPIAVESLVNTVALGQLFQPLIILSIFLLLFLGFSAALKALQTVVVETIQRRLFARVAGDLAYRIPRLVPEAAGHHYLPEVVNRFFEVATVQKVTSQLLIDGVSLVIGGVIGMVVLAFYHPWLLGIDLTLVALMVFVMFVLGRGAVATSIQESHKKYAMASWLQDLAACDQAFRYAAAPDFALDRADHLTYEYLDARRHHFRILMRQVVFTLFLQAISSAVMLGVGGWLVMQNQLTLGQLVAAELIVTIIVGSFAKLGKHIESFYDLLASSEKLGHLMDLPILRQEGLVGFPESGAVRIEFTGLACHHHHSKGVSPLTGRIAAGDRVALKGPSGSGKSTFVDLLCGRLDPTDGKVTLDGIDPRDLRPDVLQRHVAVVAATEVFTGTLAENVHLGRPDVSTHDVRKALEQVGLLDVVLSLPDGLESQITRSGRPLTELQLRRLTLARAIVAQPRLLIIDGLLDAFSDDDAYELTSVLCSRRHDWTLILVTGRKALTPLCDQTLELRSHNQPLLEGN